MQIEFTFEFAAARATHEAAFAAFKSACDIAAPDEPTHQAIGEAWQDATDELLMTPAGTVSGLGEKLAIIDEREIRLWEDWPRYRDALDRDFLDLRRPAATIRLPFEAWRAAYLAHYHCTGSDDEAHGLCTLESEAYKALLAAPCCSPGDFLVKAYVGLINELGSGVPDPNRSAFEIDIEKADHPAWGDDAWQRSAYRDLDHSDLGAGLLAFGRLEFSAEEWLERAEAIGLSVRLVPAERHSVGGLVVEMRDDGCDERITRERNRLRRMLAFDPRRAELIRNAILESLAGLVASEGRPDQHASCAAGQQH